MKLTPLEEAIALARRTDPETSHEAAATVPVTDLEAIVLEALRKAEPWGATIDELVAATGLPKVSVSPRLRPLFNKGLVATCGKRKGDSGRSQLIWLCRKHHLALHKGLAQDSLHGADGDACGAEPIAGAPIVAEGK